MNIVTVENIKLFCQAAKTLNQNDLIKDSLLVLLYNNFVLKYSRGNVILLHYKIITLYEKEYLLCFYKYRLNFGNIILSMPFQYFSSVFCNMVGINQIYPMQLFNLDISYTGTFIIFK